MKKRVSNRITAFRKPAFKTLAVEFSEAEKIERKFEAFSKTLCLDSGWRFSTVLI
jgi:hypothetical protein